VYAFAWVLEPQGLCVLPDDRGGGLLAGRHLLALGRRRIAHVTGPMRTQAVRDRAEGLAQALMESGLGLAPDAVLAGEWSEAWGREAISRLIAAGTAFDAIFCGSDQIARGVSDALRDRGLGIPKDVAIVGFDNWEIMATANRPPLTTIDMNRHELGRQAGLRLLAMIDGEALSGVVRIPCSLIIRESCGAGANSDAAGHHLDRRLDEQGGTRPTYVPRRFTQRTMLRHEFRSAPGPRSESQHGTNDRAVH